MTPEAAILFSTTSLPEKRSSGLLIYEDPKENFFLLTAAAASTRVVTAEIPPREYIFVVDVPAPCTVFP